MDKEGTWNKVLNLVKSQVSAINFRGWFLKASISEMTDKKIVISVPTAFFAEQLKKRYFDLILQATKNVTGNSLSLEFRIDPSKMLKVTPVEDGEIFELGQMKVATRHYLNPKYTLENFVVGPTNNLAFAAAQAVTQKPGLSYNPLFIYGGTGVGKTHLMIGIGNAIAKKYPHYKINCCSSEKFTNDYVEALQTKQFGLFRSRYRNVDILLIDDIQFFSGREGTQEEFFHTFNELSSKNSQIVITSDRAPYDIVKLEDRLKSRFQGGLMIDIQIPDFDTRVAILKNKCQEHASFLDEGCLNLIASAVETNARDLEGKLIQILQSLKTKNLSPTEDNIRMLLGKKEEGERIKNLAPRQVITKVCEYFSLKQTDLTGPRRVKGLVLPRHLAMYILSEELRLTVEKIGELLGGRDHTTVMHGRDKVKKMLLTDRETQRILIEIKQSLST